MADLELAFGASPVGDAKQTAFIEGALNSTETTIELDLGGEVRLAAIAFESGFAGATISVSSMVPWASGEAAQAVSGFSITVVAGGVVPVPYEESYFMSKLLLTVNAGQTATKKIGFFGWRGEIQ